MIKIALKRAEIQKEWQQEAREKHKSETIEIKPKYESEYPWKWKSGNAERWHTGKISYDAHRQITKARPLETEEVAAIIQWTAMIQWESAMQKGPTGAIMQGTTWAELLLDYEATTGRQIMGIKTKNVKKNPKTMCRHGD